MGLISVPPDASAHPQRPEPSRHRQPVPPPPNLLSFLLALCSSDHRRHARTMRSPSPTAVLFLLVLVLVPAAAQRRLLPPSPPRPFDPLRSPFGDPSRICPSVAGQAVRVGSFPSSPFVWHPFSVQFAKPQEAVPLSSYARPGDGHAIVAYKLDVYPIAVNLTCPKPTLFLSYGGTVPGERWRVG